MEQKNAAFARRLYLLGGLQIHDARGRRRLPGERSQSLLAYLVLHPRRPQRREMLADLLSPEAAPERVRRNLSDTLGRLQKTLGSDWLEIHDDSVALKTDAHLWVDVWEFDRLASSDRVADLRRAVNLYAGDLLPEVYDEWILAERELRRNHYLAALDNLAALLERRGDLQRALLTLRRLILVEPLHEPAQQAYMRLLGRLGRYGEALAHYEDLCQLLHSELNIEPLPETRAVIQAIEREREQAVVPLVVQERTPFVGRIAERATVLAAVEAALSGRGGIWAVEGAAGVGKSRFWREVAAGARWRGATVLEGYAGEIPGASPFAPLADALAPLLDSPRAAQLETLLPNETLSALAPLYAPWGARGMPPDATDRQAESLFHSALVRFGETLARLAPVVLALDDLHWGSSVLWESLGALARGFARHGGLLVILYRRPEIETTPGWAHLQAWDRSKDLTILPLQPLDVDEVAQLVGDRASGDAATVHALTGGNPFLIEEWLAEPNLELQRAGYTAQQRLTRLSQPARSALESAAVLGERIPYHLWAAVTELTPLELAVLSEELVARRWLQPLKVGYAFTHDLMRNAVYNEIEPARRRALHARAAQAYAALEPKSARVRAFHLDQAGDAAAAAAAYREAGEQNLRRFAFREAQKELERALALLPPGPTLERTETALALAQACTTTGDLDRKRLALDEALAGSRNLGNQALLLQTLLLIGNAASFSQQFAKADATLGEALELARQLEDAAREAETVFLLGVNSLQQRKSVEARAYYLQALELSRADSHRSLEGRALRGLGFVARDLGAPYEAVDWMEQALAVQREIGDRLGESVTQTTMLAVLYDLGAWDRLIATAEEVLPVTEAVGNRHSTAYVRHVHGLAAYALGDTAKARTLLGQAERDFGRAGILPSAVLTRNALGLVAEDEGNLDEALRLYRSSLAEAEANQALTEAAFAMHDLGALLLRLDRPAEAIPLLETALAEWTRIDYELPRAKSQTILGLALLALGERSRAEALAAAGWALFQAGYPAGEQPQGWLWALYRLSAALGQHDAAGEVLRAAYEELQRQARAVRDPDLRRSFFSRVPLNRTIVAAYDQYTARRRVISVSLARREAPLGRTLRPDEYVSVQWTVEAPEDEAIGAKAARRQMRLRRLLDEAERQGAAPTDGDLARALGVSRRTILRDLKSLAGEIPQPGTRKRKA
jgi:DNA-binding SARP family transcriptional activator